MNAGLNKTTTANDEWGRPVRNGPIHVHLEPPVGHATADAEIHQASGYSNREPRDPRDREAKKPGPMNEA